MEIGNLDRVKFYSETDMTCVWSIDRIIELVGNLEADITDDFIDILEYYNTIKFCEVRRLMDHIEKETGIKTSVIKRKLNGRIGKFIGQNKMNFINLYGDVDIMYKDDYFEIFNKYKVFENIAEEVFEQVILENDIPLSYVLHNKKITVHYDLLLRKLLKADSINVEIILSKYLKENELFLPTSLSLEDIHQLLNNYVQSDLMNINFLKKIIHYPSNNELIICDRIKLKAQQRYDKEVEKIFNGANNVICSGISVRYPIDQEDDVLYTINGSDYVCSVRRDWILDNLDYNTLWNNFIHIYKFFDFQMRLNLTSRINRLGVCERLLTENKEYLYKTSFGFNKMEALANIQMLSYTEILNAQNIRIEEMIEWFFREYLVDEFGIENFFVKMPSATSSYLEKCRSVLPEIDKILKQYNFYVEDGHVDEELLQITSTHMLFSNCKSLIANKYIYPQKGFFYNATFLLFSDQSSIFYIPKYMERHSNFYDMITEKKVRLDDFQKYQINRINWLFENDLLGYDEDGYLEFQNLTRIILLKDLFFNEVISFWHYPEMYRNEIVQLVNDKVLAFESNLFTKNEQDYLNYYLNKSKFSNSLDLRNRYLHGTHTNDTEQHKSDYLTFLKIIVIIIVKINDDLCLKDKINQ